MVADQPGGRQVGVALDEHQRDAPLGGDRPQQRRLRRPGRALEQHVPAGGDRGQQQVELAVPADQVPGDPAADGADRGAVVAGDPAAGDQRVVAGEVGDVLGQDVLLGRRPRSTEPGARPKPGSYLTV